MLVLAIDTASADCAVCLLDAAAGRVLAARTETIGTGHAERLMGQIAGVLEEAGRTYRDLARIAVGVGPGSFTGVRIAVSAARGFALALGIPAVGVSALEGLAADAHAIAGVSVLAVIDAHRGQVYCQPFDAAGVPEAAPAVLPLAEAAALASRSTVIAGTGAPLLSAIGADRGAVLADRATGGIETVARIAAARAPGAPPVPLYLRAPDAKPQAGFAVARAKA